jgi:type II secretory pathway pseudopilin PulG
MCARRSRAGSTLVELIVAITIMSIAVLAVMTVVVATTGSSADPMTRQQAQLIAEAYLEEILLKKFYDPDTGTICPAPEGTRGEYDNVCDYRNISAAAPQTQFGAPITELSAYRVTVTVSPNPLNTAAAVNLGPLSNDYVGGFIRVLRVDVSVTGPGGAAANLTGYRTNYTCNATIGPDLCRPLT